MFGNILIDKLRFSKKLYLIENFYEVKERLDNIMSKHFLQNAYSIRFDKQYFRFTFTPTRYLDEVTEEQRRKPNLNLEMVEQEKLLELLLQIYDVLGECNLTWIDITKNIITNDPVNKYTESLSKRKFKYPYKQTNTNSDINNNTLTLSSFTTKKGQKCRNLNRQMSFYSKTRELERKSKVPFIDNVTLSNEEIKQIPISNYIRDISRLYLNSMSGFNILRCEQRYKYTTNIKRITHYLLGSKEQNEFTLSLMIDLLKNKLLYRKLEEFYTNELREYIFFVKPQVTENKNKYIQMFVDLMEECNEIDPMSFQHLFSELGDNYKSMFIRTVKIIQSLSCGIYYNELYQKFNI